jgi:hypothetical protein
MSKPALILSLLLLGMAAVSQTPTAPEGATGVIRLRVRVGQGTKARGVQRKRFFLLKGSLEENRSLIERLEQQQVVSRECYYRSKGASNQLIAWLKENDCESVYCREVEPKSLQDADAVPEFQRAVADGEKEFGSREIARKWVTVNLPNELRSGFYKLQQQHLREFVNAAESRSQSKVMSVMTDLNGTAYFTDIEPGKYVVSSILAIEIGEVSSLWNCEMNVKPGDLATENPYLISNLGNKDPRDVKNIKCFSLEKPLPACAATARRTIH